jgi:hypothetical protein
MQELQRCVQPYFALLLICRATLRLVPDVDCLFPDLQGKEKFVEQFAGDSDEEDFVAAAGKRKGRPKPPDFRALFSGNTDDHFRMGIRITRGQVKLFADLVNSDIIVASPLALATKIAEDAAAAAHGGGGDGHKGGRKGGKGGGKGAPPPNKRPATSSGSAAAAGAESDFLSSIEVVVVERADVMLMQNWQHVLTGEVWQGLGGCGGVACLLGLLGGCVQGWVGGGCCHLLYRLGLHDSAVHAAHPHTIRSCPRLYWTATPLAKPTGTNLFVYS